MDLKEIRRRIDDIDAELVGLISRRMELVARIRRVKAQTRDLTREREVIERVRANCGSLVNPDFAERLWKDIIEEAAQLEDKNLRLIGFQGEHGAYSEMAVKALDEHGAPIPHEEFGEVFSGVSSGVLDYGVVPVENSLAGNVTQVDDLLAQTELHIVAEIVRPIHHCLISLPDTDYRDIRVVYSHPQALAQCKGFLTRNKLEARTYYDTAGAALMLARKKPAASAVIASKLAAELYGLTVLKDNIEDNSSNATRFLMLSREPSKEPGDKCSIVFATADRPGALLCILSAFAESEINLTRIESRPMPEKPGVYAFLLDFLGSDADPKVQRAISKVRAQTAMFRLLGCYKRATP